MATASCLPAHADGQPRLKLRRGDHIAIIGHTLADWMQHDGWLETYLVSRFPEEVVFEKLDLMPHNFVVTQPGSLEPIGQLSAAAVTQPGALERGNNPRCEKVIVASRLLQPRDAKTIRFEAPTKPGVYPHVRTCPGH